MGIEANPWVEQELRKLEWERQLRTRNRVIVTALLILALMAALAKSLWTP